MQPLNCREAMQKLYDYLDGELSPEVAAQVRAHIESCRPCFQHTEFERDLLALIAAGKDGLAASADLKARIRAALAP